MKIFRKLFDSLFRLALSKTAVNTYFVFFGNGLSAFFAFIFTVMYTNNLSWADVGYFSALLSLLLLVSDLSDVGIGTSLSNFLPPLEGTREKLSAFLKTAFFLQFIISAVVIFILFLLTGFLGEVLFHNENLKLLLQFTFVGILFTIFANFCQYALSARQKFIQVSFLSAFGGLVRLLLLFAVYIFSVISLPSTVYMQTFSVLILLIMSVLLLGTDFLKVKRISGDLVKLLKFTSFLGIARGLTALASRLDVLMIISLSGPTEAGIYATASRIIAIYPLLSGSFGTVIAPKLSTFSEKKGLKNFMMKVIMGTLGLIGTVLALILFAKPFMLLLFPQKGMEAISVFQLLLFSMIFFVGSLPAVSLAVYFLKKPHILTVNSVLQLFVVFIGNLIFIPKFGRFGATYSLIIAYSITLFSTSAMTLFYLKKKLSNP